MFSEELIGYGASAATSSAITAAMPGPTGLAAFGEQFPDRMFDVGIAEQHAVTSAAGLALGGLHPVVAIYSTFLNRAFDQMLMDVALLKLPVTFVLDRVRRHRRGRRQPQRHVGPVDAGHRARHAGRRAARRHPLREELAEALAVNDGPTAVRFPKGNVGEDISAIERIDGVDVLRGAGAVGRSRRRADRRRGFVRGDGLQAASGWSQGSV